MNELNDDWLSWPPEAIDRFFQPEVPTKPLVKIPNIPQQPEKPDASTCQRVS